MSGNPRKVVGLFSVLLIVWGAVYWGYRRPAPPITLEVEPLAGIERGPLHSDPADAGSTANPNTIQSFTDAGAHPADPSTGTRTVLEKPKFWTYTVRQGDVSWETISRRVYGDRRHWKAISQANPFVSASKLVPGKTELSIPVDPSNIQGRLVQLPETKSAPEPSNKTTGQSGGSKQAGASKGKPADKAPQGITPQASPMMEYIVKDGDTLSGIAKAMLGKSSLWPLILEANRDQLDSESKIKKGMTLKIPPAPAPGQ